MRTIYSIKQLAKKQRILFLFFLLFKEIQLRVARQKHQISQERLFYQERRPPFQPYGLILELAISKVTTVISNL